MVMVETEKELNSIVLEDTVFVYDGHEKRIELDAESLPDKIIVEEFSGTFAATNAGKYSANVKLKYIGDDADDTGSYYRSFSFHIRYFAPRISLPP